jgi:hypothetical protein
VEIRNWNPKQERTKEEEYLLKRLKRNKKLFAFLRENRQELFDEEFQAELALMYRDTGAGKEPVTPAMMAMAVLLQEYAGVSDAEAVELTVVDKRWQLVLDQLGETRPAFSQGAFWDFRARLIRHDMDRRLLERTRALARKTKGFDWKKLPQQVRVAMDSSPLEGAGRVEDTLNLLAHAARKIVTCVANLLDAPFEQIATEAGVPLLLESSVKAGLDLCWENPGAVDEALGQLVEQLDSLQAWVEQELPDAVKKPPLHKHLQTLAAIRTQDLEPDPTAPGRPRIRQGTARDRRISIEDSEMRHGRKSQSYKFNGFKRHLAVDLDTGLILACALEAANRPEHEAAETLHEDIKRQGVTIDTLYIDRGYIASPVVQDVLARNGEIICRPWNVSNNNGRFAKADFHIDVRDKLVTCPGDQTEPFEFGQTVTFDAQACAACSLRPRCTNARADRGRSLHIAHDEELQQHLRQEASSSAGRQQLRERVIVEHKLAHLAQRQGHRARYRGTRKNLFDLRRAATIQNLEVIQRQQHGKRKAA